MAKQRRKDLDDPGYRKARRRFMDEWDGPCHWCKRARATEVDHVVGVVHGIDPTDESNWVGSCKKCNARRGANDVAKLRQKKLADRQNAQSAGVQFFDADRQKLYLAVWEKNDAAEKQLNNF
jgi:hypothetical protein